MELKSGPLSFDEIEQKIDELIKYLGGGEERDPNIYTAIHAAMLIFEAKEKMKKENK